MIDKKLIGISGKKQSGKDTVGNIIAYLTGPNTEHFKFINNDSWFIQSKFNKKKFADKLKDIVCLLIGCTREQLEDEEFKNTELGEEWWYYKDVEYTESLTDFNSEYVKERKDWDWNHAKLIKPTPRLLLQLVGTECGRDIIHPNIWCNSLFSDYYGDIEEWKDIKEYEGLYQVSSFGNVRSLDREIIYGDRSKGEYHSRKGILLNPTLSGGYKTVSLSGTTFTVHSLVAKHFLNEPFDKDYVINHVDYNKQNNFYKNLEWITQNENIQHNYKVGKANIGEKQKDAKLTDDIVLQIKDWLYSGKYSNAEIAKRVNVSPTTITDIKKGRKWNHVGKKNIEINPILPQESPNWIITDVRFPNELEAIKSRGGILVRVNRDYPCEVCKMTKAEKRGNLCYEITCPNGRPQHESETALDNYKNWDYVIDNDGTIEELISKVKKILIKEKLL